MIGIFDSGSGGLTVLKALRQKMPKADVLYFGDLANAPYGEKDRTELSELTIQALTLLKKRGAGKIISACNSVSASLVLSLFDAFSIAPGELVEMVGPAVSAFKGVDTDIVLCATPATVASRIYQDGFKMIQKEIQAVPIAGLAGAIEADASVESMRALITKAFEGVTFTEHSTLLLGCTHYPLILPLFKEIVPPSVNIVDPAFAVAERAFEVFPEEASGEGAVHFLLSKDSLQFRKFADAFLEHESYDVEIL